MPGGDTHLPGHRLQAGAVTQCLGQAGMLRWLHLASFCVLLKYAKTRTVPVVEWQVGRREEEMDDPSLVLGRFSSCPYSFHLYWALEELQHFRHFPKCQRSEHH